jgi:hypothetical protein
MGKASVEPIRATAFPGKTRKSLHSTLHSMLARDIGTQN